MQVNLIWQWDAGGRYWRDWVRARKWSSREAAYRRTGAIYFAVSEEMDAAMRKLETLAANAESYAFEKVMKEFPTLDKSWDDKLAIKWFEDLRAQFTEQKIPDGSPTFVAVDRAFTHTAWACKDRRRRFLAPELRRDRIPSLRLACGSLYGRPITSDGDWLTLPEFGAIRRWNDPVGKNDPTPTADLASAVYVEVGRIGRAWAFRFIFSTPRDIAPPGPKAEDT